MPGRPFERGKSGNPSGRPRGIGRLVREAVGDDMPKIVRAQVAIAQGRKPEGYEGPVPKPSEITKAAEWVRDTGWHKPTQITEQHNIDGPADDLVRLEDVPDAELDEIIAEGDAALAQMEAAETALAEAAATEITEPDDPGDDA